MQKFTSRKLWTAILGSALLLAARALDLDVGPDQLYAAAGVLISYLLGQGLADAAGDGGESR
ncbi:MAG: hypothetical protein LDL30_07880 [Desulfovibrio sp.]|nr:hypothetical protein [Desulfovibrio sp.]MCA1985377.1 hypothetical protein [Desulfovibrio sp.]